MIGPRTKLTLRCIVGLLALASVSTVACGGKQVAPAAASSPAGGSSAALATSAAVKTPGEANVGDTARCPVSGEEFTVEAGSPKAEHDGKTYYFCCAGCKKKFEAGPSRFTKTR